MIRHLTSYVHIPCLTRGPLYPISNSQIVRHLCFTISYNEAGHVPTTNDEQRKSNFGLINRTYPTDSDSSIQQWKRFESFVRKKEEDKKEGESFKVLFAESKYGTHAWDCYYSVLDGFDSISWADANLTSTGQDQARDVNRLWAQQLPLGIPAPETYYVSPLTRTIETADLSFQNLSLPEDRPYKPFIKELLREALGVHTCDRRSTKTEIEVRHPCPHHEHACKNPKLTSRRKHSSI
jgi:hypothetical protein